MAETREQIKARLQAAGKWKPFVARRDELKRQGLTPAEAREQALREIDAGALTNGVSGNGSRKTPEKSPNPDGRGRSPASLANLKRGSESAAKKPKEGEGATDVEAAMNAVASQTPAQDRGPLEKAARAWLRKDPRSFMLELGNIQRPAGGDGAAKWDGEGPCPMCGREPEPVDEGELRLIEVLEKMRRHVHGEEKPLEENLEPRRELLLR